MQVCCSGKLSKDVESMNVFQIGSDMDSYGFLLGSQKAKDYMDSKTEDSGIIGMSMECKNLYIIGIPK